VLQTNNFFSVSELIVISGSFTITTPIVNSAQLMEDDLIDKTSTIYQFLIEVAKNKVSEMILKSKFVRLFFS